MPDIGYRNVTADDVDDVYVRKEDFDLATMINSADGAGSGVNATTLDGVAASSIRCSNNCSWTCSSTNK